MSEWAPATFEEFMRRVNRELKKSTRATVGATNKADDAQSTADGAVVLAGSAQESAELASAAADAANAAADAANQAALDAAGVAAGKGKVIYQPTKPTGANAVAGNLWIRSSDGKTFAYDASVPDWVQVTDPDVVSAAQAAAAAQQKANDADSAAKGAQQLASNANLAAAAAQSAANAADTKAGDAQTTANQAVSAAGAAQTKADQANSAALDAAGIANGKGKVIFQVSKPTGANAAVGNLWIRTTDNKPFVYDSSIPDWVAVTDKAATDAAAAAAAANTAAGNAQTTANTAVSNAAAAQQTANQAQQTANAAATAASGAQASANGKNTIKFRTAPPSTSAADAGTADGDLWFVIPDVQTGIVTGQFTWMASTQAWVQQTLSSAVLASIDAGKITTGTLTGVTITGVTITGTTVTGGTVQTSATGKRVVLANNVVTFYGVDGTTAVNAGVIEGIPNGAAGGLMNFRAAGSSTVFLQLGTQALPSAGSAQVYSPGAVWFPTIYTTNVYDAGSGTQLPLGDSGWITPTLVGGTNDTTSPFRYRRINGVMYFDGLVTPTGTNLRMFVLPAGYRPSAIRRAWIDRNGTSTPLQWIVRVHSGGAIDLIGPSGGSGALDFGGFPPFPVG